MALISTHYDYCPHREESIERGSCVDCREAKAATVSQAPAFINGDPGEHYSYTFGRKFSGINEAIEYGKRTGSRVEREFQFGKRRY